MLFKYADISFVVIIAKSWSKKDTIFSLSFYIHSWRPSFTCFSFLKDISRIFANGSNVIFEKQRRLKKLLHIRKQI